MAARAAKGAAARERSSHPARMSLSEIATSWHATKEDQAILIAVVPA